MVKKIILTDRRIPKFPIKPSSNARTFDTVTGIKLNSSDPQCFAAALSNHLPSLLLL